jgi:hypothetical protein
VGSKEGWKGGREEGEGRKVYVPGTGSGVVFGHDDEGRVQLEEMNLFLLFMGFE